MKLTEVTLHNAHDILGVEKNATKTAIKKQASSRAYDNMDEVIIDFVNRNRDTLFSAVL